MVHRLVAQIPVAVQKDDETSQHFEGCFPKAGSCTGLLEWQAEARRWLDDCRKTSSPRPLPVGDNDRALYDLREGAADPEWYRDSARQTTSRFAEWLISSRTGTTCGATTNNN